MNLRGNDVFREEVTRYTEKWGLSGLWQRGQETAIGRREWKLRSWCLKGLKEGSPIKGYCLKRCPPAPRRSPFRHGILRRENLSDLRKNAKFIQITNAGLEKVMSMTLLLPRKHRITALNGRSRRAIFSAVSSLSAFSSNADPLREIANYLLTRRS